MVIWFTHIILKESPTLYGIYNHAIDQGITNELGSSTDQGITNELGSSLPIYTVLLEAV